MLGCGLQHLYFFSGDVGRRLQTNPTLNLLESDGDVPIDDQSAARVNLGTCAYFKARNRDFEPISNNAKG